MKVSTSKPFEIVYSLFQHEYLGYLFESFVVQLDEKGNLTFLSQNISIRNAQEFSAKLDDKDFEIISLIDSMQQDAVVKFFEKRRMKAEEFFVKHYQKENPNQVLINEVDKYLEKRRAKILSLVRGKQLYEMSNDGEPAGKKLKIQEEKASILFHFRRNEDNTHYFPTIKHNGEKVEFQYQNAYIVCNEPAWLVVGNKLYSFHKDLDGKKLQPFLNKKFIAIPRKVEDTYFRKFVVPLVASFDVYAKGFDIVTETYKPVPHLIFSVVSARPTNSLFDNDGSGQITVEDRILFELSFSYGDYKFKADFLAPVSVHLEHVGDDYTFHRIKRSLENEKKSIELLKKLGLELKHARATLDKGKAFAWIQENLEQLTEEGFLVHQNKKEEKRYFIGKSRISLEVHENIDWFDIHGTVQFGPYEIPFVKLRKLILKKQRELVLPNNEVAIIPEAWFTEYTELFAFMEEQKQAGEPFTLKKYHLALVQDMENNNLAKLSMSQKLHKLKEFETIEDHPLPAKFQGELRPYQKAGYNWLQFLDKYKFGGCLADDMGLGKTVQTLAMLQHQKEMGHKNASLLIMPTSLLYNWQMEAQKFTPELKVFVYAGSTREKDIEKFGQYDLILTSYGITRMDIDILVQYNFNYIILDESQAIKNPNSNIAKAVKKLRARNRLILTGTPIENSTMDLWSQMTFINPGLLGNQTYFKNEFLIPIEKKNDDHKTNKLYTIIKPFILRRHKSQVATELPEKVENIQYSTMTTMQEEKYEEVKNMYRNKILDHIEESGLRGSQFLLLQGLTALRQIANHPKLIDPEYIGDSGKLEDVTYMLQNAIGKNHKILVFSQFVRHLQILKQFMKSKGINYAYLDGKTRDRQAVVDQFQGDDDVKVFLISLKAGGVGLNLTKADYVFILDPWWNPAIEAQAIDRAHRIGQENKVFTYKFITKNTVEEKILKLQQKKKALANELITTEESFIKHLSKEDISSLLE